MQRGPQGRVIAKLRIGEHRRDLKARGPHLPDERQREPPLLLEPRGRRDARTPTRRGREPLLGEIELRAEHPRLRPAPQRGRHGDLAIGDLAQGAAVLPRHADRVRTLLRKTRAVEDQDTGPLRHRDSQPVPQAIGVPRRIGDEVLKRLIAPRLTHPREHRAHRLARAVTQQAEEVPAEGAALGAMAKCPLERLQPRQEPVDPRGRIAG